MLNWGYAFMTLASIFVAKSLFADMPYGTSYREFWCELGGAGACAAIAVACVAAARYLGG